MALYCRYGGECVGCMRCREENVTEFWPDWDDDPWPEDEPYGGEGN